MSKSAVKRKWSSKYKKSIDCNHPRGFSQRQHCKYGRKSVKKSSKKSLGARDLTKRKSLHKKSISGNF